MLNDLKLNTDQVNKFEKWRKEQDEIRMQHQLDSGDTHLVDYAENGVAYYGASGGSITLSVTPTGIGAVLKVKHNYTGEELDLTDYESW